ncbi:MULTISPECIES: ABC transporter substrate-binding protein [Alteromonas]|jgi:putative spermidine/putrescine transport system substrate-binding protein|uniref:Signal peptide prediction n=1 Tax=Alteromonas stellipolaris TaxID=233316 RepID=A0AAW7Z613_9ALTE|nr:MULTISPECIES: substrate-binding domain-containing protein [Alteromonas]AMJ91824.1 signal peptide prediction [Alteromonas sp. Mac2]ALM89319.1 ABC transporter, binding protein [Alteromonas stellipolaris LMG 21856]AMJ75536.1 signal peptide prediction [Alteromonas stellipolaris]AMJ87960.1 signal peptide prediction [Alteromonas sp. Mac1]ANB21328.1 signal peptide prediction [Alteromonas stellipolaris]
MPPSQRLTSRPRRSFIKGAAALGVTAGVTAGVAPFAIGKPTPTLKVMGTHVTLQEEIRQHAMADLGINIAFQPGGSATVLQKASMNPGAFDLYEQWSNSINVLWRSKAIQPIEKKKLTYWDEINDLTKTGKVTDAARLGAGDAPHKIINVQADGSLGIEHTDTISFLPYVHNVDSFGYNTSQFPEQLKNQEESWGWLLDSRLSGKVGIVNDPTIGLFDLALAAQAKGYITFEDIGAMTTQELDNLFSILIELSQLNHFSGFWTSVPESVQFMKSQRVSIESMFSPAVSALNSQNIPVKFAAPKEGYRGWHGVMCLSSASQGRSKDVAYEYMNWWLSGWPGAFIARQGYYISNPERSAKYLSQAEWDYWYKGLPASENLKGPAGKVSVQKGEQRSGGSYEDRFSNIAVWNTVMPTYEYSLQKWYEFITS